MDDAEDSEPEEKFNAADEEIPEDSDTTLGAVRFDGLSPTDFEEFCYDLMPAAGFTNVDWRKGTLLTG